MPRPILWAILIYCLNLIPHQTGLPRSPSAHLRFPYLPWYSSTAFLRSVSRLNQSGRHPHIAAVVGNKVVNTAFFIARQGKQGVFAYCIVGIAYAYGKNIACTLRAFCYYYNLLKCFKHNRSSLASFNNLRSISFFASALAKYAAFKLSSSLLAFAITNLLSCFKCRVFVLSS